MEAGASRRPTSRQHTALQVRFRGELDGTCGRYHHRPPANSSAKSNIYLPISIDQYDLMVMEAKIYTDHARVAFESLYNIYVAKLYLTQ